MKVLNFNSISYTLAAQIIYVFYSLQIDYRKNLGFPLHLPSVRVSVQYIYIYIYCGIIWVYILKTPVHTISSAVYPNYTTVFLRLHCLRFMSRLQTLVQLITITTSRSALYVTRIERRTSRTRRRSTKIQRMRSSDSTRRRLRSWGRSLRREEISVVCIARNLNMYRYLN